MNVAEAVSSEHGEHWVEAQQAPASHLERGIHLLQQKSFADARQELLKAVKARPASAEAFFYLGLADVSLGHDSEAEAALRHSLKLDSRSTNTLYNLGVLLLMQKRAREALPYLERANELGPRNAALSVNLVRAYLEVRQEDRALRVAAFAERQFRGSAAFYLALGQCFLGNGLLKPAVRALETANRLAPAEVDIVIPLASGYLEEKDASDALRVLATIASPAWQSPEYHNLLATGYFLTGQKRQTLAEMNRAVNLDPRNPAYLIKLARLDQKYGDQQNAVKLLERAAHYAPQLAEIPYSEAVSYFSADDFTTTVRFVKQALRLDPQYDRALFLLGITQFAEGKLPEAEQNLQRALELRSQNAYYHCFFGMLLMSENKLSGAQRQFEFALRLDPNYALAHYQLGRLLVRKRDYTGARTELERAIAQSPDLPEAYYELAHTYWRLGEKRQAESALASFRKYQAVQYSEREEMLKQAHVAVQSQH